MTAVHRAAVVRANRGLRAQRLLDASQRKFAHGARPTENAAKRPVDALARFSPARRRRDAESEAVLRPAERPAGVGEVPGPRP